MIRVLAKAWKKTGRYFAEFGVTAGLKHLLVLRVLRPPRPYELFVPTLGQRIKLRPHTSDVYVLEDLVLYGNSELPADVSRQMEGGPGVIIDGGANIGISTLLLSSRWPNKRVVAVECDASNYALLGHNVAGRTNVSCVCAALWDRDGAIEVTTRDVEPWSISVAQGNGRGDTTVPAITVKTLMEEQGERRIDLLKLDIEGAEREVLSTLHPSAAPIMFVLVELHERKAKGCEAAMDSFCDRYGFNRMRVGEYFLLGRNA